MEKHINGQLKKRKLKFLLLAPVVFFAFLVFIFWSLGGGKTLENGANQAKEDNQFNTSLPQARIKEEDWDKLKFYEEAKADSLKRAALIKEDPYYQRWLNFEGAVRDTISQTPLKNEYSTTFIVEKDSNEERVQKKIAQITAQLNKEQHRPPAQVHQRGVQQNTISDKSVDRLERMMMNLNNSEPDPEMAQLNEVLDKLGALQNPESFEKWQKQSEKQPGKVFTINLPQSTPVTMLTGVEQTLEDKKALPGKGFFTIDEIEDQPTKQSAVPAMVYGTQVVGEKSKILLKLLKDVLVNGVLIPANHEVVGQVLFSENTIQILVTSIISNQQIFPVSLSAFSINGVEGLPVSGNMAGDFARQSADQAVQNLTLAPSVSSLGGEAINATLQAARSLINKKTKPVFITVPSGTQLLLSDKQNQ